MNPILNKIPLEFQLDLPIEIPNYIICSDSEYIHTNLHSRPDIDNDTIAIIQISAIKINLLTGEYYVFNELINPGEWDDIYWKVCTNITKKEKANHINCLDFDNVFNNFLKFIEDYPIVVMNQDVDIYSKLGKTINNHVIKLKPLLNNTILKSCSSGELCNKLGFPLNDNNPHDGLFDSINIGTIIYSLNK
jgi:hypothetical protein